MMSWFLHLTRRRPLMTLQLVVLARCWSHFQLHRSVRRAIQRPSRYLFQFLPPLLFLIHSQSYNLIALSHLVLINFARVSSRPMNFRGSTASQRHLEASSPRLSPPMDHLLQTKYLSLRSQKLAPVFGCVSFRQILMLLQVFPHTKVCYLFCLPSRLVLERKSIVSSA